MLRIKINDLPEDTKIGRIEMKRVVGGLSFSSYNPYTRMQWNAPKLKLTSVLDTTTCDATLINT